MRSYSTASAVPPRKLTMKPFDTSVINGEKLKEYKDSVIVEPGPSRREYLEASPIVKGDRKLPNAHLYEACTIFYPRGKNKYHYTYDGTYQNSGWIYQSGCIGWNADHPFLNGVKFPESLRRSALDELNEQVRGSIDLSVDLFSAGQTARMLTATENAKLFVQTFKGWRGFIKGLSDARLAFAYGWKPLATTIYDCANESINVLYSNFLTVKARTHAPIPSSNEYFDFEFFGKAYGQCKRQGRYIAELSVVVETRDHDIAKWTSLNPVSIAWELVPYSFVVDWVFDVGSYLRNLETSLLYANRFVSGYSSEGVFLDATWSTDSVRKEGVRPVYTYMVEANASFRYRKFARSVLSSYPAFRLPSFEVSLGAGRLLNLAALIGGKLKVR